MNLSKYILIAFTFISGISFSQLNRSITPKPQAAKEIKLKKAEVFKLDNGLTVLVVENNKIPKVSFQLSVDRGAILEADKAGVASISGSLLSSGTVSMSKDKLDEEIDFMGADLSSWATGIYASSLKKETNKLAKIIADVLMNPAFPKSELDRLKEQTITGITSSKKEPSSIQSNIQSVVNYGKEHPYGELQTEKTVESISLDDVKNYYKETFQPQNSYLTIVGDVSMNEIKPIIEKHFGKWKKGSFVKPTYLQPKQPQETRVYFSPQDGAVQSNISVTYPVDLKPGSSDAIAARVMNEILGGGTFSGRLMQNLREDKAYTYGCRSSLSSDELIGSFSTNGSFRNEVSDSAITQILKELNKMIETKVTDEELKTTKASMAGKFSIALENPRTIARFALNTLKYNLSDDYYTNYLQNLEKISTEDIKKVAEKYIKPSNANIVVVGNEEIIKKLKKFDSKGKVTKLDFYGNPISDIIPIPKGTTLSSIYKKTVMATLMTNDETSTLNKIKNLKTISEKYIAKVQGMDLTIFKYANNKGHSALIVKMNGNTVQKEWFDGKSGGSSNMMGKKDFTKEEVIEKQKKSGFMKEWFYNEKEGSDKLLGIVEIENKKAYKIVSKTPKGISYKYIDTETFLPIQNTIVVEVEGKTQKSTKLFKKYKDFSQMMFPTIINQDIGPMKINLELESIKINKKIDKSVFKP